MIYVLFNKNEIVGFTEQNPYTGTKEFAPVYKESGEQMVFTRVESAWEWHAKSFEYVEELAKKATEFYGKLYLATVNPNVSPRHDLVCAPAVGDDVSYAFNGDYTPCGKIVRITPTLTVVTDTGKRFRRYKKTGAWMMEGGTFRLVAGHIDERNPSF